MTDILLIALFALLGAAAAGPSVRLRRGSHARTPPAGGGLGLAIVRGIVEAHEGHAGVRNVAGGCCFEVTLPLAYA